MTRRTVGVPAFRRSAPRLPGDVLRSLVACSPFGIFLTDALGSCTFVSDRCQALCGFTAEEALGDGWRSFVHPSDRKRVFAAWNAAVRKGGAFESELRVGRREYRPILTRSTPVLGARGRIVGRSGTVEDLTERKRAESVVRESEARLRHVIASLHEGIVVQDAQGRIVSANPAACGILGLTEDQLLGRTKIDPHWRAMREDGSPLPVEELPSEIALCTGVPCGDVVMGVRRADDSVFWAVANARPLFREGSDTVDGVVISFADITERKESERALRRLSARLLRLQDEERRRIARELHDSTAQALAALAMNLELLAREGAALSRAGRRALSESQALAGQCSREVRSMASLLHPPLLDEVGLASAVRWFCDGVSARTGLEIDLTLPEGLPRLGRELETTVFRIVQEGLTNVHRHSGSSSAAVRIVRRAGLLELEIADRGRGLPPAVLDPRHHADRAIVGVGIPGMRERVRQLGGRLEIESGAEGTVLRARLPLRSHRG